MLPVKFFEEYVDTATQNLPSLWNGMRYIIEGMKRMSFFPSMMNSFKKKIKNSFKLFKGKKKLVEFKCRKK